MGQITKLKRLGKILGQTDYCYIMVNLDMALVPIEVGSAFFIEDGECIQIKLCVKFAHKLVGLWMPDTLVLVSL